jgi:general secretion pathway protein D
MRRKWNPFIAVCLIAALAPWPAAARSRKGDKLIAQARQAELTDTTKGLDQALKLAEEAYASDRSDIRYQLEVARLRAFAAQYHVYDGQVLRDKGQVKESIAEFERAKELDPASVVAPQELERTRNLANELRRNPSANADDLLMRPLPRKNMQDERLYASTAPVPVLTSKLTKPLPVIRVNNQSASDVFQAVCREAKIRLLFDPEFQSRSLGLNQLLDFQGASLDQALDYVALVTKSFWKPLSGDTIFVTNDDPQRRAAFEEQVTKTFYLTNAPGAQEVTDIANTVQRVTDMRKLLVHPAQGVIVARGDSDRVALAEKIVSDLDKPRAEIIIDVVILSVSKNWERQLGINILGLADSASNILFNPRGLLGPAQVGGRSGIPLDAIQNIERGDYNVNLPGAALNALLKISGTKVLDKAQLRTIEGQKSVLKIGQRIPYATGSFSPGSFGGGNSIVNTQFQYFDVGLNIDVTAKVHEPDEVSLHIESDTSAVADRVDIGGIIQPVISQRKRIADVRVKEGEVNFWDIVTQRQDVKNSNGVPGLSQIPIVGRVFNNEKLLQTELQVLTLLIPHIIRAPDIRNVNLMGMPSGSDQVVRLRYSTPEGRTLAARVTDQTLDLTPAAGGNQGQPMQMMQSGMGGMQPQPGMGGMQPQQQNPGTGGMPGSSAGPGRAPGPGPMGGMPATPQPGTPMGPGPTQPGPNPTGGVRIVFNPSIMQVPMNQFVTTDVVLEGAPEGTQGQLALQFDAKVLRFTSVVPGPGVEIVSGPGQDGGRIVLKLNPGSGSRRVVALTFQATASGQSALAVSTVRLTNAQGTEIPVQSGALTIEVLPPRASWQPGTTELPGWGLKI